MANHIVASIQRALITGDSRVLGQGKFDGPNASTTGSLAWWTRNQSGKLAIWEWPNPAVLVWILALALGTTGILGEERRDALMGIAHGAAIVWALDELLRGASPFRRLLGLVVLVWQMARLFLGP